MNSSFRRKNYNKRMGSSNYSNYGGNGSRLKKPVEPMEPTMIHQELWAKMNESTTCGVSNSPEETGNVNEMTVFLKTLRENSKSTVLTVDLIDLLLENIASKGVKIDTNLATLIIEFTIFFY